MGRHQSVHGVEGTEPLRACHRAPCPPNLSQCTCRHSCTHVRCFYVPACVEILRAIQPELWEIGRLQKWGDLTTSVFPFKSFWLIVTKTARPGNDRLLLIYWLWLGPVAVEWKVGGVFTEWPWAQWALADIAVRGGQRLPRGLTHAVGVLDPLQCQIYSGKTSKHHYLAGLRKEGKDDADDKDLYIPQVHQLYAAKI